MIVAQHPPDQTGKKIPWCSVIIPTLNEAPFIGRTLGRLRKTQPTPAFEVIVADGGSTDGTVDIARKFGARVVRSERGRAAQMNAGAAAASGRYFLFLHADTLLPPDFSRYLMRSLHSPACFRLRFTGQQAYPLLRFYSYCTRFDLNAFRFGDQALWVARHDFEAVGGYPAGWQLLEDNYLVRRLRHHHGTFRVLPVAVETSPRKYLRNGIAYTQLVYALLYGLYRCGARQQLLVRIYRSLLK